MAIFRKIQDLFKSSATSNRAAKRRDVPWRWAEQSDSSFAPVVVVATSPVQDGNGNGAFLPIDRLTGDLMVIDTFHARIHQGLAFIASYVNATLAHTAFIDFLFDVRDTEAHLTWFAACGGDARLNFYRAPTITLPGTPVNSVPLNDDDTVITSEVRVTHTPTIGANGALRFDTILPGGTGGNAEGGSFRAGSEYVMAPNTLYLMRLQNVSGVQQPTSVGGEWYEVEE